MSARERTCENLDHSPALTDRLVMVAMACVAAIAFIVLLGWHLHSTIMLQVLPHAVPMQYNAAICFLALAGTGMAVVSRRLPRWVILPGASFLMGMGGSGLFQYVTRRALGINTFFFDPWQQSFVLFPGLMPMAAALCFSLAGAGLALFAFRPRWYMVLAIIGIVPVCFGVTASISYLLGVYHQMPFNLGFPMAILAVISFILWGLAMTMFAWIHEPRKIEAIPGWAPVLASVGMAVFLLNYGMLLQTHSFFATMALKVMLVCCSLLVGLALHQYLVIRRADHAHALELTQQVDRTKDEFMSVVSHELRTPIAAVFASLKLISSGVLSAKPEQQQQMLELAIRNTERLMHLTDDILDLTRLESGQMVVHPVPLVVDHVLESTLASIRILAEQARIILHLRASGEVVMADPDRVAQVLTNLLSNAIKFSLPGSSVWLEAEKHERFVRFVVRDEGIGIPLDKQDAIFSRFSQVDSSDSRQKGGTGLGLSICKSLIKQQGGDIGVQSESGHGSTFWFTLPRVS